MMEIPCQSHQVSPRDAWTAACQVLKHLLLVKKDIDGCSSLTTEAGHLSKSEDSPKTSIATKDPVKGYSQYQNKSLKGPGSSHSVFGDILCQNNLRCKKNKN